MPRLAPVTITAPFCWSVVVILIAPVVQIAFQASRTRRPARMAADSASFTASRHAPLPRCLDGLGEGQELVVVAGDPESREFVSLRIQIVAADADRRNRGPHGLFPPAGRPL